MAHELGMLGSITDEYFLIRFPFKAVDMEISWKTSTNGLDNSLCFWGEESGYM